MDDGQSIDPMPSAPAISHDNESAAIRPALSQRRAPAHTEGFGEVAGDAEVHGFDRADSVEKPVMMITGRSAL
jgi:hypothetical protein